MIERVNSSSFRNEARPPSSLSILLDSVNHRAALSNPIVEGEVLPPPI